MRRKEIVDPRRFPGKVGRNGQMESFIRGVLVVAAGQKRRSSERTSLGRPGVDEEYLAMGAEEEGRDELRGGSVGEAEYDQFWKKATVSCVSVDHPLREGGEI